MKRIDPEGFPRRNCRNPLVPSAKKRKRSSADSGATTRQRPRRLLAVDDYVNGLPGDVADTEVRPNVDGDHDSDHEDSDFEPHHEHTFELPIDDISTPSHNELVPADPLFTQPPPSVTSARHIQSLEIRSSDNPSYQLSPVSYSSLQPRALPQYPQSVSTSNSFTPCDASHTAHGPQLQACPSAHSLVEPLSSTQVSADPNSMVLAISHQISSASHMLAISTQLREVLTEYKFSTSPQRRQALESTLKQLVAECTTALQGINGTAMQTFEVLREGMPTVFWP
jgi:hypothetical protein